MKIVFMGTPDFAVPVLEAVLEEGHDISLVVTQPDRPKGRKKILTPPPVKTAAEKHRLPVFQPEKIKNDFQPVAQAEPDLIITAAFGQLLPPEVLAIPPFGSINVHASLLPKYRGGAPIHYAVMNGEKLTGITIMYMAEKLDAGDMLLQRTVPIRREDTTGTMHDKLSLLGAEMIKEILPLMENGALKGEPQDDTKATFAPNITKEKELIDWEAPAEQVYDQIRGLNPWPVAYTTYAGKRLKIWEADPVEDGTDSAPGTVTALSRSEKKMQVACGGGTVLSLKKVQPSGKKPMDTATFLNGQGREIETGMVLGKDE